MRDPTFYVSGLLDLGNVVDAAERRALWRQSMAALARATSEDGPGPLDGLHPEALARGVRAALAANLVDDLDFLAPAAAGAALYELAVALPIGPEQRELGRRVLTRLLAGNAEAFVIMATRMALGAGKGLGSLTSRARIALVAELPISLNIADGPLALALCSRRELAREWIAQPSTGSLPARRLAARLIERAAREAARRASQGDDHSLRAFQGDAVSSAWKRLLADRESLVWRHVAVARGLLAPWVPDLRAEIDRSLAPELSPTEWRRGATSIAAQVAVSPEIALRTATNALSQDILARDQGVAAAFVWGVPRAAEAEPDAAEQLLTLLLDGRTADLTLAEAIYELGAEFGPTPLVDAAAERVLGALGRAPRKDGIDDGADALAREIARDLNGSPRDDQPLRQQISRALAAFVSDGARAAYNVARELLDAATAELDALEAVSKDDALEEGRTGSMARRASLAVLRDLDISVLERNTLADLLKLGPSETARPHEEALDGLRDRLADWILAREAMPYVPRKAAPAEAPILGIDIVIQTTVERKGEVKQTGPSHPTLRLRRLRALLHLVDSDLTDGSDDGPETVRLRRRWMRVARALILRFERDPPSVLRRTILAALARALDALLREGGCDVADALLVVCRQMSDPAEFETLAEASMDPDFIHVLQRYAAFLRSLQTGILASGRADSLLPPVSASQPAPGVDLHTRLRAFEELASELSPDASGRAEALRVVLVRLHAAMAAIVSAPSLQALSTSGTNDPDIIVALESALGSLVQLVAGARARLNPERSSVMPPPMVPSRPLSLACSRVLSGAIGNKLNDHVLSACVDELMAGVPASVAQLASTVIWSLADLPLENPTSASGSMRVAEQQLPAWLPARRTIGGYYVLKALGSGAVGSVFVVNRVEERHDPNAERFALKVPEYTATAARSLSEAEFLQMFRAEASALMQLPAHQNLARFLTFDLAAKPKPILVMELVEGTTLERTMQSRALEMKRALHVLDDVLSGLEAMHSVGVGHLDVKPSNVVINKEDRAVLVDFGLAGRHVRPGCTTGPYGAPEVWGVIPTGFTPAPSNADVYAFGCLAYETLTGQILFNADSEIAQIGLHVAHDGSPPPVRAMSQKPELAPLGDLLYQCLRRDPRMRPNAETLRAHFRKVAPKIARLKWPISPSGDSR